ncbi:MAG: LysR family transcriptional regulator [Burkholderiales bacterium]|nr:LysR family transcriptional regulator [Burkholderiales bacterium]
MTDQAGDLRLMCQLVEAGSLSEAARRFDSSPPALSRRLAAMESRLGVRLFERSSRRFALTQEGTLLHQRAQQILAAIDDAEAEVSATGRSVRGTLRVGAPTQIGRRLFAPLAGRFSDLHPDLDLRFVLTNAELDAIEDELDIAIRIGLPDDGALVARKLMDSRRVVCAAPSYLERHGIPQVPDDLLRHKCLRLLRGRRTLDRWRFVEDGVARTVEVGGTLATTSGEVLYDWALEGRGLALKALWNVEDDLASGRLVQCLADYSFDEVALYATWPRQGVMPRRMRVFLDFLAAELQRPAG